MGQTQWHWGILFALMLVLSVIAAQWISRQWARAYATALVDAKKALDGQVCARTQASNDANKAKSVFLASMSHEIRTPLNAILGYSQILRRTELNQQQQEGMKTIERSGKHLLALINDILDLSKIEAGGMELHPEEFDLFELIEDIAVMVALRCEQKQLLWRVQNELAARIAVYADQKKLRQILINLLSNAVKFTHQGEITLRVRQLPNQAYEFAVTDTGIGLSVDQQARVFLPFHQESAGIDQEGTGLGLSIAKKQVEMMGGRFALTSELGKGSCFSIQVGLAVAKASPQSLAKPVTQAVQLKPGYAVNALVVDDIKGNRDILSILLRDAGLHVAEAVNGQRALACMAIKMPDIVFLDIHMPVMDGVETLRRIRADYAGAGVKCVVYTASSFAHNIEGYMQSGFDAFIGKPFDVQDVYTCISGLLNVEFNCNLQDSSSALPGASDIQLNDAQFQALWDAAELGQVTVLVHLLSGLKEDNPRSTEWTEYVETLIEKADTDGVLSVLERVKKVA